MICPYCGKAVPFKISDAERAEVLKLHREGYSARDIAAKTGVSFSSAARIVRQAQRKKP